LNRFFEANTADRERNFAVTLSLAWWSFGHATETMEMPVFIKSVGDRVQVVVVFTVAWDLESTEISLQNLDLWT